MARIWKATSSWFFNTGLSYSESVDVVAETPDHYLMHTKKCLERLSLLSGQAAKFDQEQCKYLSYKLNIAFQSARSITEPINTWYFSQASPQEKIACLEIFKFLLSIGLEAEGFIQDCYKDEWIQNAIMMTKVSEHVASMGFNLELCTIILTNRKSGIPGSLTPSEVTNLRQAESEIVKEKSDLDERKLCVALRDVTRLRLSSSTEWQLATFLLGRLESGRLQPSVGSMFGMKNLKQMESLGKGASAIVHRAIWLGTEVAKKTFNEPSDPDFLREVSILAGLSHPNILPLLWYPIDPQRKSFMIMELMDGDLFTLMEKRTEEYRDRGSPFSIFEAFDLVLQIAEGMLYLHEKRVVHRDLKSSSILVKSRKARELDFEHVQIKVADFGLSRTKEKSITHSQQTPNVGTTRWMAPEMMTLRNDDGEVVEAGPKYPFKSDVYSFGVVCFEILTGDVPFSTLNPREVRNVVLGGGRPRLPAVCPSRLRTLIEACWSADPSKRPDFGRICADLRHLMCGLLMTSVGVKVPRSFSLKEIRKMTNEFDENKRLTRFNEVYKGEMVDTGDLVAVERVQYNSGSLSPEGSHHKNLMGYVGYCDENGERVLVFEYMPNRSLAGWLSGNKGAFYHWAVRRNICLGVANGIHYLHTDVRAKTIRRSINVRTIFLDDNFEPKIAGYWGECSLPELGSEKEDVYNYGAVLFQIVGGRLGTIQWVLDGYSSGIIQKITNPTLHLRPTEKIEAMRFIRIAYLCMLSNAATRPDMARVVAMLQGNLDEEIESLSLQHKWEISELQWSFATE